MTTAEKEILSLASIWETKTKSKTENQNQHSVHHTAVKRKNLAPLPVFEALNFARDCSVMAAKFVRKRYKTCSGKPKYELRHLVDNNY